MHSHQFKNIGNDHRCRTGLIYSYCYHSVHTVFKVVLLSLTPDMTSRNLGINISYARTVHAEYLLTLDLYYRYVMASESI